MSSRITGLLWRVVGLEPHEKLILLKLADQANDEGYSWPSVATIALEVGLSERAVQRWLAKLEGERGFLRREARFTSKGLQTSSGFWLNLPAVAAAAKPETFGEGVTVASPSGVTLASPLGCQQRHPGGDSGVTPGVTVASPSGVTAASPKPLIEPSTEPAREPDGDDVGDDEGGGAERRGGEWVRLAMPVLSPDLRAALRVLDDTSSPEGERVAVRKWLVKQAASPSASDADRRVIVHRLGLLGITARPERRDAARAAR